MLRLDILLSHIRGVAQISLIEWGQIYIYNTLSWVYRF